MCPFVYCNKTGRANPISRSFSKFQTESEEDSAITMFCSDVTRKEHDLPLNRVVECLNSPIIPGVTTALIAGGAPTREPFCPRSLMGSLNAGLLDLAAKAPAAEAKSPAPETPLSLPLLVSSLLSYFPTKWPSQSSRSQQGLFFVPKGGDRKQSLCKTKGLEGKCRSS